MVKYIIGDPRSIFPPKQLSFGERKPMNPPSMSQTQETDDEPPADTVPSAMTGVQAAVIRVGDCEADPALNVLRRNGKAIHLEPKAMELLSFLAGRAGEVVTRDEQLAKLSNGLVVGDDGLAQAVIKLRKALGDSPREPRYIQTVPKRGYRLIAEVGAAIPQQKAPGSEKALGFRSSK